MEVALKFVTTKGAVGCFCGSIFPESHLTHSSLGRCMFAECLETGPASKCDYF